MKQLSLKLFFLFALTVFIFGSANNGMAQCTYTVPYSGNNSIVANSGTIWDYVTVFDGVGVGGTQLFNGSGAALPPVLTSTTGALTLRFTSDGSITGAGFSATISNFVVTPPSISGFTPSSGCAGGVSVVITGANYSNSRCWCNRNYYGYNTFRFWIKCRYFYSKSIPSCTESGDSQPWFNMCRFFNGFKCDISRKYNQLVYHTIRWSCLNEYTEWR